jgi:hypothetical protein
LLLGTLLTLFVVPTAYTLLARKSRGARERAVRDAERMASQPHPVAGE